MRSIDALPIACIVAALGLAHIWQIFMSIKNREPSTENQTPTTDQRLPTAADQVLLNTRRISAFSILHSPFRRAPIVAAGLAWALALVLNAWTYFAIMPADREVWTAFYPLHTRIGAYVRSLADARGSDAVRQVYVPDRLIDNPVFEYLTYQLPVQTFAGDLLSTPAQPGAQFILPASTTSKERDTLIAQHSLDPTPLLTGPLMPDGSAASFIVYRKR
jgi:hypothetical protein